MSISRHERTKTDNKEKKKTIGGKFKTKTLAELRAEFNNEQNKKRGTQLRLDQCFSGDPVSDRSLSGEAPSASEASGLQGNWVYRV